MKTKVKRHIPYRSGIATEVILGDLAFFIVARTAADLADAFRTIPGIKDPYREDLSQHVKITLNRTNQEPVMKQPELLKKKPRNVKHVPVSHREKPMPATRISQEELDQARKQAEKFLRPTLKP
jgi:hypothetical protein